MYSLRQLHSPFLGPKSSKLSMKYKDKVKDNPRSSFEQLYSGILCYIHVPSSKDIGTLVLEEKVFKVLQYVGMAAILVM